MLPNPSPSCFLFTSPLNGLKGSQSSPAAGTGLVLSINCEALVCALPIAFSKTTRLWNQQLTVLSRVLQFLHKPELRKTQTSVHRTSVHSGGKARCVSKAMLEEDKEWLPFIPAGLVLRDASTKKPTI